MKELPFTGHQQDTSVAVTINHCYQYCSRKEGGTKTRHEDRQKEGQEKERKEGKKAIIIQMKMRAIRLQGRHR